MTLRFLGQIYKPSQFSMPVVNSRPKSWQFQLRARVLKYRGVSYIVERYSGFDGNMETDFCRLV